jgi:hypothetical protein
MKNEIEKARTSRGFELLRLGIVLIRVFEHVSPH